MARKHLVIDCATGTAAEVAFTPEEEIARDAQEAAWAAEAAKPRPVSDAAKLDALASAVHALATGKPVPADAVEVLDRVRKK